MKTTLLASVLLFAAPVAFASETVRARDLVKQLTELQSTSENLSGSTSQKEFCKFSNYKVAGGKSANFTLEGEHDEAFADLTISLSADIEKSTRGKGGASMETYSIDQPNGKAAVVKITTYEDLASFDISVKIGSSRAVKCQFSE